MLSKEKKKDELAFNKFLCSERHDKESDETNTQNMVEYLQIIDARDLYIEHPETFTTQ